MEVKDIFNLRKLIEKWMKWELRIKKAEMFLEPLYNRGSQSVDNDPEWTIKYHVHLHNLHIRYLDYDS